MISQVPTYGGQHSDWSINNNGRALYNFTDLKPGDQGGGTFDLKVTSNDAYVCAKSTITGTPENDRNYPELNAGDVTTGANDGELQNYLKFATYADLNNNGVYDPATEPVNVGQYISSHDSKGITAADLGSAGWVSVADTTTPNTWLTMGTLPANQQKDAGLLYCFGNFTTTGSGAGTQVTGCDGTDTTGLQNQAQTDGVVGSIQFYAVQTRNNPNFKCSDLQVVKVQANDLYPNTSNANLASAFSSKKWFMYNDTSDEIDNSLGVFVAGPPTPIHGTGSVQFTLDSTHTRKAMATYQFSGTSLASITQMSYGAYSHNGSGGAGSNESGYLNFNVDFTGSSGAWQQRLVYVPSNNSGAPQNTWNNNDVIQGGAAKWVYSGATWPTVGGAGTTPKTWAQIKIDYPNARLLPSGGWLGVKVGEPGPDGYIGNVDFFSIATGGAPTVYDFEN